MDKCLIFSNLEVTTNPVTLMKIKPLIQLREMISKSLSGQTNLDKIFRLYARLNKNQDHILSLLASGHRLPARRKVSC